MSRIEPLKMAPLLVSKVWGGRKLATLGKVLPDDRLYGEAWEVADLAEGQSVVSGGYWDGSTLAEVRAELGPALIGTDAPGERFPLLVKILDAAADLSVQVHPGHDDLERFPGAASKDEAWMILESDGGTLLLGFEEGVDETQFRESLAAGRAVECLHRVAVDPGQVFRLGPGTVHAICAGTCLLEIQEPSDTTFRLYDYNRPGLDGKPRALHLDEGLSVANFAPYPGLAKPNRVAVDWGHVDVLVDVPAYRIERSEVRSATWSVRPESPQVVFVEAGECTINGVSLKACETAVIPAALRHIEVSGAATIVVAGLGGHGLMI